MATISSHTLNGSDGTHAGGRLTQAVAPGLVDPAATYQLLFELAAYWATRDTRASVTQIALRFAMPDPEGSYHMPVNGIVAQP